MNWDDLRLFLTVSRQPKLEEAALTLNQDATTLSRRLRRLEHELGLTLFERTRRGHILTPQGEALSAQVEGMEATASAIESQKTETNSVAGRVRIGVTEGLGATIIAPAFAGFVETWPALQIDLIALSGFVSVPKREADMSILLTRPRAGRLRIRKLTDYTLQLYAARDYLKRHETIEAVRDLGQHSLIGYVEDLIYSPQLRYFDEVLPGLAPRLCSPSILSQAAMTRAGAGLCILPKFIASQYDELIPVLADQISVSRSFWLTIHEDVYDFRRIRLVSDLLISEIERHQHDFV